MKKMRSIAFASSIAVVFCFVLTPLAQAGPGGNPGPAPPPEPPGQGGSYPPGVLKNLEPVETTPIWKITAQGTALSVIWTDHEPNPRFAIYDYDQDNQDPTISAEEAVCDDLVLDKETGLVWERCPGRPTVEFDCSDRCSWYRAIDSCEKLTKGNRTGWRLPALVELQTILDPSQGSPDDGYLAFPPGHPFFETTKGDYWTSTTSHSDSEMAVAFGFVRNGQITKAPKATDYVQFYCWCVRGGPGYDGFPPE